MKLNFATENSCVVGSIPTLATSIIRLKQVVRPAFFLLGQIWDNSFFVLSANFATA
jgi:hypothetical protein